MVESVKHSATYALDAKHMVELYTEISVGPKRLVSFLGASKTALSVFVNNF